MQEKRGDDSRTCGRGDQGPGAEAAGLETRIHELESELEESNRERSQYKEALLRAQADLSNYKRRSDEERGEQLKYANSRLILKVLPVLGRPGPGHGPRRRVRRRGSPGWRVCSSSTGSCKPWWSPRP